MKQDQVDAAKNSGVQRNELKPTSELEADRCVNHCGHDPALQSVDDGSCTFVLGGDGAGGFEFCGHKCEDADLARFLIIEPHADGSVYIVNPDPLLRDPVNGMEAVLARCDSLEEAREEARRLVTVARSHVPIPFKQ